MQRSLERSQHAALLILCLLKIANASPYGIRGMIRGGRPDVERANPSLYITVVDR